MSGSIEAMQLVFPFSTRRKLPIIDEINNIDEDLRFTPKGKNLAARDEQSLQGERWPARYSSSSAAINIAMRFFDEGSR